MPTVRNSSNSANGLKQLPTSSNLIFPLSGNDLQITQNQYSKPHNCLSMFET